MRRGDKLWAKVHIPHGGDQLVITCSMPRHINVELDGTDLARISAYELSAARFLLPESAVTGGILSITPIGDAEPIVEQLFLIARGAR